MNSSASRATPWYFWLVAIVTLLWNSFGGYDYYMTQSASLEYIGPISETYGLNVDEVVAYYDSFPIWVDAAWGLAIWASVGASVLLMMRSGFAYYAFVLSFIAMIAAHGWQLANPMPGVNAVAAGYIMAVLVTAVLLLEMWFAKSMAKRGVLR